MVAILLTAVALVLLLFQWNWLRGPLAAMMSSRLHRPVRIVGDLDVHPFTGSPWASVGRVLVGGRDRAAPRADGPLIRSGSLEGARVAWRWGSLLRGRIDLPLVEVRSPRLDVLAGAPAAKKPPAASNPPAIDHLRIHDGRISYADPVRRIVFAGTADTDERRSAADPGLTTVRGSLLMRGADGFGPRPVLDAPRLTIGVRLLPLMRGDLQLPLIEADRPVAHLARDAAGRGNWETGRKEPTPKLPTINRLIVRGGRIDYADPRAKLTFAGTVSTTETVGVHGQGAFGLTGRGTLNSAPFSIRLTGGPLINVDQRRPYPFAASVVAGATRIDARGQLAHPFHFDQVAGSGRVRGPDLADLFTLTRVALPSTPPYDLAAGFARRGQHIALRRINGRMGQSDLEGSLDVDKRGGRPFLAGDLVSRRLRLADLTAVAGGVPKHTAGKPLSPLQRKTAARLAAERRIFPDTHLQLDRIRSTDAAVSYRAARVDAGRLPITSLYLKTTLDRGRLDIAPLRMALPQGAFTATIHLDATGATPRESLDARLANARLEHLAPTGARGVPVSGGLFAHARLSGTGDSVRAAAASANGALSLAIPGGEIRQSFAELLGIDLTKAGFLLLTKNEKQTPIRCAVADFEARDGILSARRIVLDTGVVLATGSGQIDLRDETLNLRLSGKPKKFRLVRIGAPITLTGRLAAPKPGVDIGKAAPQVLAGAALGAIVAPLAALLPFINPGLAKNADCAALLAQSR